MLCICVGQTCYGVVQQVLLQVRRGGPRGSAHCSLNQRREVVHQQSDLREGGREGGRVGEREGGREEGMAGGREGGRGKRGREGGERDGGREGGRDGGREGGKEREGRREGRGSVQHSRVDPTSQKMSVRISSSFVLTSPPMSSTWVLMVVAVGFTLSSTAEHTSTTVFRKPCRVLEASL